LRQFSVLKSNLFIVHTFAVTFPQTISHSIETRVSFDRLLKYIAKYREFGDGYVHVTARGTWKVGGKLSAIGKSLNPGSISFFFVSFMYKKTVE